MKEKTAAIKSYRLPIVLIQMQLRREVAADPIKNEEIAKLLPPEKEWDRILRLLQANGHSEESLEHYMEILFTSGDEERCRIFLEQDMPKPGFLLAFILRSGSGFTSVERLDGLINYFGTRLKQTIDANLNHKAPEPLEEGRALKAMEKLAPEDIEKLLSRLAFHCRRIEPRRLIKLAEATAEFIMNYQATSRNPEQTYHAQCKYFNQALVALAERKGSGPQRKAVPYAYLWEAQRILLGMSGSLPRALLVNRDGFNAIRFVLAGMPKNRTEQHSARRHSRSWPPHLRPGDGMDETLEPDESWSRVVRAGMMMQEAGFPKTEIDDALDILQGLAREGSPTIQQRVHKSPARPLKAWAASITATRNAQEAWDRFQHPPQPGQKPGPAEYSALFQRLYARDADPEIGTLPGDNTLNYDTNQENNLTDLERERLKPPHPDALFEMMKSAGVGIDESCLVVLVSNADSLQSAHRYLLEGATSWDVFSNLLATSPEPGLLKLIPLPLFSAYIDVCSREPSSSGRHISRAIRLSEIRLSRQSKNWGPYIWAPILKNLGQHPNGLGIKVREQLQLVTQLVGSIEVAHGASLSLFFRFIQTFRKIMHWQVKDVSRGIDQDSVRSHPIRLLYRTGMKRPGHRPGCAEWNDPLLALIRSMSGRMKELFQVLVETEKENTRGMGLHDITHLDAMRARGDPVLAPYAHECMLALAYAGEFEEMARLLRWLFRQWANPKLLEEIDGMDEVPRDAEMHDTLCAFRAFAEPMLSSAEMDIVLRKFNEHQLGWQWPDEMVMQGYLDARPERIHLIKVLHWASSRGHEEAVDGPDSGDMMGPEQVEGAEMQEAGTGELKNTGVRSGIFRQD